MKIKEILGMMKDERTVLRSVNKIKKAFFVETKDVVMEIGFLEPQLLINKKNLLFVHDFIADSEVTGITRDFMDYVKEEIKK